MATTAQACLTDVTKQALHAASVGDLDALGDALALRGAALLHAPPAERIAAFHDGEAIRFLLKGIKCSLKAEISRLEQIKTGLGRSAEAPPANINLRA